MIIGTDVLLGIMRRYRDLLEGDGHIDSWLRANGETVEGERLRVDEVIERCVELDSLGVLLL